MTITNTEGGHAGRTTEGDLVAAGWTTPGVEAARTSSKTRHPFWPQDH